MNIKENVGGCSCKIESKKLSKILSKIPKPTDKNFVSDFSTNEDCSVYKVEDIYVCESLDFFPMISDNHFTFGQIATCNALSDVYAMGVVPKYVTNIVSIPKGTTMEQSQQMFAGQNEVLSKLGVSVAGGHSIEGDQLLFGMSVTGFTKSVPLTNNNIKVGQYILISKMVGSGPCLLAHSVDDIEQSEYDQVINELVKPNAIASLAGVKHKATAMTDITGFGLIGHLSEMTNKDCAIEIDLESIPTFARAKSAIDDFYITKGGQTNREMYSEHMIGFDEMSHIYQELICDPQTSGGLAISVDEVTDELLKEFTLIGSVVKSQGEKLRWK